MGLLILGLTGTGWGAVWYVATDGSNLNDGQSWASPFQTIQTALDSARTGDEIWVEAGTYVLENYIFVQKAVSIYGGFNGTETLLEERDWINNVTTVDGNGTVLCFYVMKDATIDGFTITNGYSYDTGGGMRVYRCAPTISNCIFSENSSDFNGGGIQNYLYASPTIASCTFYGNTTNYYDGGGVYNYYYSSPTLTNCLFHGNSANRNGGGIVNYYRCSPTITNCTFFGNSAGVNGGGIYNYSYATPVITNTIFWGDSAPDGAEIYSGGECYPDVSHSDILGGYEGTGNIDADPDFVDPTAGDFHLSRHSPSPCIDAGDPSAPSLPATDFEGDPRIIGLGPDMGFDEFLEDEEENGLEAYVLYAKEKVRLRETADSQGDVGSNGRIRIASRRCGRLEGDLRALEGIGVLGSMTVDGDVVTNGKVWVSGVLEVTGRIIEGKDAGLSPIELPERGFTAGSRNVWVWENFTATLDPGTYRNVWVMAGATLKLYSGDYYIDRLDIGWGSTVSMDPSKGPITINVVNGLHVGMGAEIETSSGTTRDVIMNVLNDHLIWIGPCAKFRGTLSAPNSRVILSYASELEGSVYARRISVDKGVCFRHHGD